MTNKVWNHTKNIRCSRCLAKVRKQENCFCEKCNEESFNLPFDFFKDERLVYMKKLYESWLNTRLERNLARKQEILRKKEVENNGNR